MEISASDEEVKIILPAEPYKGIKPFRYADRSIFSGRDWEKEQLLNLILLYRGSLLYGESGIGKSSLVNAGLIPLMEENRLQPEIIRIYPNYKEPFRIHKIENSDNDKTYLPSLFDKFSTEKNDEPRIFVTLDDFKNHLLLQTYGNTEEEQAEIKNKPIPVLLFDQFEEVITLFEETGKVATANGDIPVEKRLEFQAQLFAFFCDCYYNPQLRIKFLFSFREDYLAKMSKLLRAIPDLRDHSLRIKAIDKTDIIEIIQRPFQYKKSASYYDLTFQELIPVLNNKLVKYFDDQNAVLTDVQIVCQYLYDTPADRPALFTANEDENIIDCYIQSFYAKLLEKLPTSDKPLAIAILSLLVLNEHTRNIFHTDAIVSELKKQYPPEGINAVLIKLDEDTRLIKSELRAGSTKAYYEINSESLIPYINSLKIERERKKLADDLEEAKQREKTLKKEKQDAIKKSGRFQKILIALISLLFLVAVIWAYKEYKSGKSESYFIAAKRADNPSLGYAIAKLGLIENKDNDKLSKFANEQINTRNLIIYNILFSPDEIITGFFKGSDTVGIISKNTINYFNNDGLLTKQIFFDKITYADVQRGYLINDISNSLISLSINKLNNNELRTFDGKVVASFFAEQNPQAFAISPDGQTFVVDKYIYKKGVPKPVKQLDIPVIAKGLTSLLITDNSKYIIAGFYSGLIIVYDLNGKRIKAIQNNDYNSAITCMAVTTDLKYLVSGGSNNSLYFFELQKTLDGTNAKGDLATIYPTYLGETGTAGTINQIIIAPDNKTFLSIGDDKKGNIWNFNGKNEGELIGHKDGIVSGSYSANGKYFLTCSSAGAIYMWSKPTIDIPKVALFSPLDYRLAALEDIKINDVYKKKPTANELLSNILNYTASLPQFKADSLTLKELSTLYTEGLREQAFNQLSSYNKKLLLSTYIVFRDDSLNTINTVNNSLTTISREYDKMSWQKKVLMTDTVDIQNAILSTYRYTKRADAFGIYLPDPNYQKAFICLKNAIQIADAFSIKYPDNTLLQKLKIEAYASLSWYALFVHENELAITAANKCIAFDKNYDWAITNIALGTLLKGNFAEAKFIYGKYKNVYKTNGTGLFKVAFLKDFQDLTKAGIIDVKDKKLSKQIEEIKIILNSKS